MSCGLSCQRALRHTGDARVLQSCLSPSSYLSAAGMQRVSSTSVGITAINHQLGLTAMLRGLQYLED